MLSSNLQELTTIQVGRLTGLGRNPSFLAQPQRFDSPATVIVNNCGAYTPMTIP